MLTDLKLRDFRCFVTLECEFGPGMNIFVGPNAQGKTSLLEAACVLLRLQSPRIAMLGHAIQHDKRGFVLDGHFASRHLQFYFSPRRKKLALDSVEQKTAAEYLQIARVVYFSNTDIEMVRGSGEQRRKFLDFVAMQINPAYRQHLRAYEKALRSRNHLLKAPHPRWREIAAFDQPLIDAGNYLTAARSRLITSLQPIAEKAQLAISGSTEALRMEYAPGAGENFSEALDASRVEDARLRQTSVGPHRDDVALLLNDRAAGFGSEGQQRSIALALKLAQADLLQHHAGTPPLLLLDDIFGELDVARRNALLSHLPASAQKLITSTHIHWLADPKDARIFTLQNGALSRHTLP